MGVGVGQKGAEPDLEFVSVVSDQGSCPHPVPSPWVRLSLACVCVAGKGRLRVNFALSTYICFSVESLSGSARPSYGSLFPFWFSLSAPTHPTPILYLFLH